jgi:hypothetical protein
VLGACSFVFMAVVLTRWLAHGVSSLSPGMSPIPAGRLALIYTLEWGSLAALVAIVWHYLVRPLVSRKPLTYDGLLVAGFVILNFWDQLDNYLSFTFQYNAHLLNVGAWGGFIPGWQSAHGGSWAVPVAFVFGAYVWGYFIGSRLACAVITRARHQTAPSWLALMLAFLACAVFEAICELAFLQTELMANVRTARALTLWAGTTHQWPLYDPVLFAAVWATIGWLRWAATSTGTTFLDRGIERLRVGRRSQTLVRFLALSAFLQLLYISVYFVPWNLLAQLPVSVPHLPSYFPT